MNRASAPTKVQLVGWTMTGTGTGRRGVHASGWRVQHCGHMTALHPWALYDPEGRLWTAGAAGPARNPTFGAAWNSLAEALQIVLEVLADPKLLALCHRNAKKTAHELAASSYESKRRWMEAS